MAEPDHSKFPGKQRKAISPETRRTFFAGNRLDFLHEDVICDDFPKPSEYCLYRCEVS